MHQFTTMPKYFFYLHHDIHALLQYSSSKFQWKNNPTIILTAFLVVSWEKKGFFFKNSIYVVLFSFNTLQLVITNLIHSISFITGFCRGSFLHSVGLFGGEKKSYMKVAF